MRTARNEINVTPTAKLWRSTAVSQPSAREQQKSPRQPVLPLSLSQQDQSASCQAEYNKINLRLSRVVKVATRRGEATPTSRRLWASINEVPKPRLVAGLNVEAKGTCNFTPTQTATGSSGCHHQHQQHHRRQVEIAAARAQGCSALAQPVCAGAATKGSWLRNATHFRVGAGHRATCNW